MVLASYSQSSSSSLNLGHITEVQTPRLRDVHKPSAICEISLNAESYLEPSVFISVLWQVNYSRVSRLTEITKLWRFAPAAIWTITVWKRWTVALCMVYSLCSTSICPTTPSQASILRDGASARGSESCERLRFPSPPPYILISNSIKFCKNTNSKETQFHLRGFVFL